MDERVADDDGAGDEEVMTSDDAGPVHRARRWVTTSVAIVFGLFYAYDLFEAISNLIGVAQFNTIATDAGLDLPVPWSLPIITVALPPVAYLIALALGRRHGTGTRALLLLAALALVAAVTLSVTALV